MKQLCSLVIFMIYTVSVAQKQVIVDADTGNEVDDLYALVLEL